MRPPHNSGVATLETDRLLFRPHEFGDLDGYCEMMADPEFRRMSGGSPLSRPEAEKSFSSVLERASVAPMVLMATILKSELRYIGRCGLYAHESPDTGVLAYYIARPYWGRGVATEAARAFVEYGFEVLKLRRIVAGASASNVASNRILRGLGMAVLSGGEYELVAG